MKRALHEQNRLSWNAATVAHNRHKGDQAAWLRSGGSTLFSDEIELLGDITGQDLVHLQCNSGQDTLSLQRLGARVCGVDISDEAIDFARRLSADSGIPGEFVRSDLFDWFADSPAERFDVAFASYGVIGWLSDLKPYGRGLARILRPGGVFALVEFHPAAMMFDRDLSLKYPYAGGAPEAEPGGVNDYVALSDGQLTQSATPADLPPFENPHPSWGFGWGLAEVLTALIDAGLAIEVFREFHYSNGWKPWDAMKPLPGRRWAVPDGLPNIPLMYGIRARKPATDLLQDAG